MDSAMEMQIYKEIVDKMRQLMALEGEDKEEMEMPESLAAVMGEEDKQKAHNPRRSLKLKKIH